MNGGAIDAEEDPIRDGRPGRVLRIAIETHLIFRLGLEFPEDNVLVGEGIGRHWKMKREKNGTKFKTGIENLFCF